MQSTHGYLLQGMSPEQKFFNIIAQSFLKKAYLTMGQLDELLNIFTLNGEVLVEKLIQLKAESQRKLMWTLCVNASLHKLPNDKYEKFNNLILSFYTKLTPGIKWQLRHIGNYKGDDSYFYLAYLDSLDKLALSLEAKGRETEKGEKEGNEAENINRDESPVLVKDSLKEFSVRASSKKIFRGNLPTIQEFKLLTDIRKKNGITSKFSTLIALQDDNPLFLDYLQALTLENQDVFNYLLKRFENRRPDLYDLVKSRKDELFKPLTARLKRIYFRQSPDAKIIYESTIIKRDNLRI